MEIIDDFTEKKPMASAGQRFLAALIDGLLGGVLSLIPIVGWIGSIAYALLKDSLPFLNGQSLGKKAMNIRVVKADTQQPITNDYGTNAIRAVSLMIPIFGIIDALMVFSESKQRFGDRWANTIVVKEK